MNIEKLEHSLLERLKRIHAMSLLSQVILKNISECYTSESPTKETLKKVASLLPEQFTNNARLNNIPEAKVLCFVDSQNFITLISEVDAFLYDTLVYILMLHPKKMGEQKVSLEKIIGSTSTSTILRSSVDNYIHHIMYKSPKDYRKKFLKILSADDDFLTTDWKIYIEAKARRDVGVHNDWIANSIYRDKVNTRGNVPNEGSLTITSEYLLPTQASLTKLMQDILHHCKLTFKKNV